MTDPPKLIPPPPPEPDTHWCLTCDPPTRLRGSHHAGPDHPVPVRATRRGERVNDDPLLTEGDWAFIQRTTQRMAWESVEALRQAQDMDPMSHTDGNDLTPFVDKIARIRYETYDSHFTMPGGLSWEKFKADDPAAAEGLYLHDVRREVARATPALLPLMTRCRADGWDEGYYRGTRDAESDLEPADNPYRRDEETR